MLLRATRAKLRRNASVNLRLQQSSDQLLLPWLCPAQLRHQQRCRSLASVARPTSPKPAHAPSRLATAHQHRRRQLATATATAASVEEDQSSDVSWSHDGGSFWRPDWLQPLQARPKRLSTDLPDFDPASPIIINTSLATPPRHFKSRQGFGSNLAELHLTLKACLQVGRMDRAAALVRRFESIYAPDAPDLRSAHNSYLRTKVGHVLENRDEDGLREVQRWFEVEMRSKGVEPDATTYALLVKVSLQLLQGPKLERTVRRYMDLAADAHHDLELLNLPILSDSELYRVTKICPTDFYSIEEAVTAPSVDNHQDFTPANDSPRDLRPVQLRGLGLDSLQKSLSIFSDSSLPYPDNLEGSKEDKDRAYAAMRQQRLEDDAVSSAIERWRQENEARQRIGLDVVLHRKSLSTLLWEWYCAISSALKEELRLVKVAESNNVQSSADKDRRLYGDFLRLLPLDKLAAVTILSAMASFSDRHAGGVRLSSLVMSVGKAIEDESIAVAIQKRFEGKKKWRGLSGAGRQRRLASSMKSRKGFGALGGLYKLMEHERHGVKDARADSTEWMDLTWTNAVRAKVGAVVVSALISTAKMQVSRQHPDTHHDVVQEQPAFFHSYQYREGRRLGMVTANSALIDKLKKEPHHIGLAKHLPMVAEPKKWDSVKEGGFFKYRAPVMRSHGPDPSQLTYVKAAVARGDMDQIFAGLDVLAKTPWTINQAVFDVMAQAWNTGDAIANIAPEDAQVDYPADPSPSAGVKERYAWNREVKAAENTKMAFHSQRCFQNFQLEIARAFLKERFYFPHNIDFRGRAYPMPPYFNHMGADHCRGLLKFAEAKELGSAGLTWLKIHLANLYGYDKASFKEREGFTTQHLSDVYDSAVDPLGGKRWWLKAEDPWQCLAACFELKAALDLPDPSRFQSSLPVHQDGTCNGLQHYAALGGDMWGAKQVNLEPGDRPADVYTGVAELVKKEIAEDASKDDPLAKDLDGKISRKVVKQTVMTNVYGVTFVGAREQVKKQLEVIMPEHHKGDMYTGLLASYVAKKIFKAMSTMFKGAHDIQHWLAECANRISQAVTPEQLDQIEKNGGGKARVSDARFLVPTSATKVDLTVFKSPVIWTTPLKLPVVQPYRQQKSQRVTTNLQRLSLLEPSASDPVSKRKQLQGFPPNFIHSLDATHMLLSALKCDEIGVMFASVHDSFWTHAADVDTMNRVLREAFIRMHSEDIIGRLAAEFAARYKGCMYMARVRSESAVGRKIRAWRKSNTGAIGIDRVKELMQERQRQRLLQSTDAADRARGRAMVTAASIFDAAKVKDLEPPKEMTHFGQLPGRPAQSQSHRPMSKDGLLAPSTTSEPTPSPAQQDDKTEPAAEGGTVKGSAKRAEPVHLWLPLTFPAIPQKGDFDVSRLTHSQYFFS